MDNKEEIMTNRECIITNYIEGYNEMDVDKMVADFDANIIFENIQNGRSDVLLSGLSQFRQQAESAIAYFVTRTQTIKSIRHTDNQTEIEIDYNAVLNMDFPNGLKKGQSLQVTGKSIFLFAQDKIIKLTDVS